MYYVCTHIYMYMYTHMYMYVYVGGHTCVRVSVCIHIQCVKAVYGKPKLTMAVFLDHHFIC